MANTRLLGRKTVGQECTVLPNFPLTDRGTLPHVFSSTFTMMHPGSSAFAIKLKRRIVVIVLAIEKRATPRVGYLTIKVRIPDYKSVLDCLP